MKLSIVTIVKSDPEGLKKTIQSCLPLKNFFASDFEHIIIDATPELHSLVLKEYEENIKIFEQEACGVYSALNFSIQKTSAPLIWQLHAGDELVSMEAFLLAYEQLERSEALACFSPIFLKDPSTGKERIFEAQKTFQSAVSRGQVPHPGMLFRSEVFDKVGNFDERYSIAADLDFFVRMLNKNIPVLKSSKAFARFSLGGLSTQNRLQTMKETKEIIAKAKLPPLQKALASARASYGLFLAQRSEVLSK